MPDQVRHDDSEIFNDVVFAISRQKFEFFLNLVYPHPQHPLTSAAVPRPAMNHSITHRRKGKAHAR